MTLRGFAWGKIGAIIVPYLQRYFLVAFGSNFMVKLHKTSADTDVYRMILQLSPKHSTRGQEGRVLSLVVLLGPPTGARCLISGRETVLPGVSIEKVGTVLQVKLLKFLTSNILELHLSPCPVANWQSHNRTAVTGPKYGQVSTSNPSWFVSDFHLDLLWHPSI